MVKQRKDSWQQFTDGGREDLAAKEAKEVEILALYMPKELGPMQTLEPCKPGCRSAERAGHHLNLFGIGVVGLRLAAVKIAQVDAQERLVGMLFGNRPDRTQLPTSRVAAPSGPLGGHGDLDGARNIRPDLGVLHSLRDLIRCLQRLAAHRSSSGNVFGLNHPSTPSTRGRRQLTGHSGCLTALFS
jgi:Yqey-like protein